jgi:hypothetical protein
MINRKRERQSPAEAPSAPAKAIDWSQRRDSIDEIARRLDELLLAMAEVPQSEDAVVNVGGGALAEARRIWRARRERERIFGATLAADPAWDILLDLFIAQGEGRKVTVSSASAATSVPEATVLRCIAHLVEAQLVARQPQRDDAANIYLMLTDRAVSMISEYLGRTTTASGAAGA